MRLIVSLLRISCFLIFLGRAWQHLVWDAPLRAFFWDQNLLEGAVSFLLGMSWSEYVTNPSTDLFINILTRSLGLFYLAMAVLTLVIKPSMKRLQWSFKLASVFLAMLAFLYCKEKFYHIGQFFEYSIQFGVPILFCMVLFNEHLTSRVIFYLKLCIALTFVAHGMYAFGYYPRPGVFVDMTINILGVSENMAHQFLRIAGVLDLVVGIGIFIPRFAYISLFYATIWGLATAIARVWANVDFGPFALPLLNQYLPQTIYRLAHGLVPFTILFYYVSLSRKGSYLGNKATFWKGASA